MKLNERQLALACAILWGSAMLFVGVANMLSGGYGQEFLKVMASVYPGYHAVGNILQVAIGTAYGFVDGFLGGLVFAWLCNRLIHA